MRSRRPASHSAPRGSRTRARAARASRQLRPKPELVCVCHSQKRAGTNCLPQCPGLNHAFLCAESYCQRSPAA